MSSRMVNSKNDPILDAAALCLETPRNREDLATELVKLGWHENVAKSAIDPAKAMLYIYERSDGTLHPGPRCPR